jgi:glycogen(starch) synthase
VSRRILLTTDVVGGVWDFSMTLASGLTAAGDEVIVLALGAPGTSQEQAASRVGARLVSVPLKLEWMSDAAEDVQRAREVVASTARAIDADVVHANQFAATCIDVDVPVVLTLHSDVLSWRRWTLGALDIPSEWGAYEAMVRQSVARADRVVALSRFLAQQVTDLYGIDRHIEIVYNGWPAPSSLEGARHGTLVAGRVWDAAKNVSLIAEAARGWHPGPVYLAGETAHPDGGVAAVPSPLRAMGLLNRADLDQLMQRSRVYVSAAKYDPFGLLPLQAALHGCMLLLSDIPTYREVWGDSACFFGVDDLADLRDKWRLLLDAPPDQRAFEHARTHLSAGHMVGAYRRMYAAARQPVAA